MVISLNLLYSILLSAAICMLLASNPIHSVLFLMIVFLCAALVCISIGADFIGLLLIIIYVGAITILFLFITMVISVKHVTRDIVSYFILGSFLLFISMFQIFFFFFGYVLPFSTQSIGANTTTWSFFPYNSLDKGYRYLIPLRIGLVIVYEFPYLLLLISYIILVATVGCIHLTNYKTGISIRTQLNQLARNNSIMLLHIY